MEKNELPNDRIPSNQEIVDSLVKSLEDSCQLKNDETVKKEDEQATERISENPSPTEETVKTGDDDCNDSDKNTKEDEDDYIDEEFLKEKEKSFTEDDINRLKSEAAELKKVGNEQFKSGNFQEAVVTYTLALRTCPLCHTKDRAVLYANRAAAKMNVHRNPSAIDDCTKAIELDPEYVKVLMRRAQLYEKSDKLDEALADYKRILELDSSNKEALMANMRLPPMINERNEKLKTEMLGKLKDLGNIVLKPFGLSTNNFQMVPNESGGYSINFKQ